VLPVQPGGWLGPELFKQPNNVATLLFGHTPQIPERNLLFWRLRALSLEGLAATKKPFYRFAKPT